MNNKFLDFLNKKNCFKLILGANNQDIKAIDELVEVYYKAGCRFFDISASSDIFNILNNKYNDIFICISIGVSDDMHFSKCKINNDKCTKCKKCFDVCIQNAIDKDFKIQNEKCIGCNKCKNLCPNNAIENYFSQNDWDFELLNKAPCAELHISTNNKQEIYSKFKMLHENYNGIISICLNRKMLSDNEIKETVFNLLSINKNIIIQADGNPMSGGCDDYNTTLQAIACGDFIRKNFRDIPLFLSGGTNSNTAKLAKMLDVEITGVSIGSYARHIVNIQNSMQDKINSAKNLIESVSNV